MKHFYTITVYLTVFVSTPASAETTPLQAQMIQSLETVKSNFMTMYAPKAWKKKHANWDLDSAVDAAKKQILADKKITIQKYRSIVKQFFNSVRNYHMSIQFYTTKNTYLPLGIKGAEDRYFVTHIDREKLPKATFPIKPNAELVTFGEQPVAQMIAGLKEQLSGNTPETDQAQTEQLLTSRRASSGITVPRGPIELGFKIKNKTVSRQIT